PRRPAGERRRRDFRVRKRGPLAVALLIVLVALAGDEDDVALPRARHRRLDRRAAIELDLEVATACGADADDDRRRDLLRVFTARVVVGHDDPIRSFPCDAAHLGTLARIAIPAAPEHADELA